MPFQTGGAGVTTLSDLEINVDKDWKAHGIYNLGDLTPKVDGAYNIGDSATQFDTVYGSTFPGTTFLSNTQIDADKDWKARSIYNLGDLTPKVDGTYNLGSPSARFDNAYASNVPPLVTEPVSNAARDLDSVRDVGSGALAFNNLLAATDGASVLDNGNLTSAKAKDIVYHDNFNLPGTKARDTIAESTYGMAADQTGVKGLSKQVIQKRDFAFRTETPNHAYWHRMYNTPAAFETVYQDYTTSIQKKGTTPSKSAPNTADPNPQPGACWSVSMVPDGTQVGGFAAPGPDPTGLAWDGAYLWITDSTAGYIYQLDKDGTQVGGFASPAPSPRGLDWDGAYLWNADNTADYIYQLKTDGTQVAGFPPIGPDPTGLAWDGAYLWNADNTANYIYQLNPDGTQAGGFASPTGAAHGLGWDGTYLWHGSWGASYIYQLKTDGTQVGGFSVPFGPWGAGWDGAYLWDPTGSANYVYLFGNAGNLDVNYRIFAK